MDCKTARFLLDFYRPGTTDLDGPEAQELEQHLGGCSECNAQAGSQRRLDQHFGRAMRAVEIPPGLRKDVLEALALQRRTWHRRHLSRAVRVGAIAASLLLAVGMGWYFWDTFRPKRIYADEVAYALNVTPPDRDGVNAALKRLGEGAFAPTFVNYAYLTGSPSLAPLPGHPGVKVPQLVFTQDPFTARGADHRAVIYVLDRRRFPLQDVEAASDYQFHLEVRQQDERVSYLIFYSGNSWDWLKASEAAE
jgi:hypothetical protein